MAMKMVGAEFLDRVDYYSTSWWPARTLVEEALEKRHEVNHVVNGLWSFLHLGVVYNNLHETNMCSTVHK